MPIIDKEWPPITERTLDGCDYWIIDQRRYHDGKRTGKPEYFNKKKFTLKQVEARASVIRQSVVTHGHQDGTDLSSNVGPELLEGIERLKSYGKTLIEAINVATKKWDDDKKGAKLIEVAVDDWLKSKQALHEAGKYSKSSLTTAERRIGHLENEFRGKPLSAVSASAFEEWLDHSDFNLETMAGIKSICSEFFKWCMKPGREWLLSNPAQFMRISHIKTEVEILKPDRCSKLLEAADKSPFRDRAMPYVLVSLGGGLRPSEAEDLESIHLDHNTREIKVISRKLRGEVRYVPMSIELSKRLKEFSWEGKLAGVNWRKQFDAVKMMAGFNENIPYPTDCLRHSFASYWLAMSLAGVKGYDGGRARLAEIMGNSEDIIRERYRQAVPRDTAEAFCKLIGLALPA